MQFARIAAFVLMTALLGAPMAHALPIDEAGTPAELPPVTFTGQEYVDSRGCVYMRVGVSGETDWIPRVNRDRQVVCGRTPTLAVAEPRQAAEPETTEDPGAEAAEPAPIKSQPEIQAVVEAPAVALPKPVPAVRPRPRAEVVETVDAAPRPKPRRVARPTHKTKPKPAAPRVVEAHIARSRQNTRGMPLPKGYRPAWGDDRLNPHRAERTSAASVIRPATLPRGYRTAWGDDRMNPRRGQTTARGDADTARIWTNEVPRKLVNPPLNKPTKRISDPVLRDIERTGGQPVGSNYRSEAAKQSVPGPVKNRAAHYVRVAAYASDTEARAAAQALARTGLPVRLGSATRGKQSYRVVLAGPYGNASSARAALGVVRAQGHAGAKLMR